jgi:hypothetical protein
MPHGNPPYDSHPGTNNSHRKQKPIRDPIRQRMTSLSCLGGNNIMKELRQSLTKHIRSGNAPPKTPNTDSDGKTKPKEVNAADNKSKTLSERLLTHPGSSATASEIALRNAKRDPERSDLSIGNLSRNNWHIRGGPFPPSATLNSN